ncbi:hypothetical protein F511_39963 [Dorcoceras hygrometricum]|uniref:Uncharacterized protein n=1 Tax=Dorcoceras hygrometricum TaxID=472368 RepID=A0A2Z7ANX9_9LAMI|nr:hypothetical protein F511_39963 [Dorcoceras hygrometricum]
MAQDALKDPSLGSDTTVLQSGPRPDSIFLRQSALEALADLPRTESPRKTDRNKSDHRQAAAARQRLGRRPTVVEWESTCVTLNGSGIQLAVCPQPLWLRNHNFGLAQRIMVKRLATSPHDSACKNQLVVVSTQYGPFNTYIPIRSTTIGKSRVARDPIAMRTSWRSNSDITSVTRTGCETPSSACTRRPDEIDADGFSSKSWPETIFRRAAAAARREVDEERGRQPRVLRVRVLA